MKPFENSKKLLADIEAKNATKEQQIADLDKRIADKKHISKLQTLYLIKIGMLKSV